VAESDTTIPWRPRLSTAYLIASSNRCGSYLLCEGLASTGVAGEPTESLSIEYRRDLCQKRYGAEMDFSVSMTAMVRDTLTDSGVFGAKVHWDQLVELWYESGYDGPPYVVLLDEFPGARYIHLHRRDTLAQAISLSIAQQTNEWWRMGESASPFRNNVEPVFDATKILHLQLDLIRQRDAWRDFFRAEGITPLEMEYETLVADYRGEVARALEFLGLDSAAAQTIPEPRLQKQGDELNALWHERLRPAPKIAALA
jgi:trehalose 2-sulfotransferase